MATKRTTKTLKDRSQAVLKRLAKLAQENQPELEQARAVTEQKEEAQKASTYAAFHKRQKR